MFLWKSIENYPKVVTFYSDLPTTAFSHMLGKKRGFLPHEDVPMIIIAPYLRQRVTALCIRIVLDSLEMFKYAFSLV